MDILKILSRGTKQPPKGAKNLPAASRNLPSAGNKPNPQLFHDDVARGQKRKRTGDKDENGDGDDDMGDDALDLPNVDYFAPKNTTVTPPKEEVLPSSKAELRSGEPRIAPPKLLDESETRQLLKSHRLKITLLSSPQNGRSRVEKSKKKKGVVVETKKQETKQLYPQPLTSFAELRSVYKIDSQISENLARESYRIPTEVQMGGLPLLLRPDLAFGAENELEADDGINFMAVAPTGSGKTISFMIPVIDSILRNRRLEEGEYGHELQAIVVAPTRELAFQIMHEGRKLAEGTDIKVVAMRKGMRLAATRVETDDQMSSGSEGEDEEEEDSSTEDQQRDKASRPTIRADVLITTPMLLLNYLSSGPASTHKALPAVRHLILDEADVLLDPLFREQTMGIWAACTNPSLRLSFWSATMGSNIEALVTETLSAKAELGTTPAPLVRLVVGLKDTAVPNIAHKLIYTGTEQGKLLAIRQLLHPTSGDDTGPPLRPPFLVFTQTIERAAALHEELKYDIPLAAGGPSRIATLHSGLSDSERASIMRRFRAGEIWVLTTTDVLSRGVDFAGVNGVVNYDVPGSSAAYIHRVGRTGRAGREGGVAVTLYTKEDIPFVKSVANVIAASERQAGREGGEAGVQKWLLDALPRVSKADKKKLKERGVEARRTGAAAGRITSQSGWERRRENNRQGAIRGSKVRKTTGRKAVAVDDTEWGGIQD